MRESLKVLRPAQLLYRAIRARIVAFGTQGPGFGLPGPPVRGHTAGPSLSTCTVRTEVSRCRSYPWLSLEYNHAEPQTATNDVSRSKYRT